MKLMLDFETLGTDPNCVVLSLGAVLFTDRMIHAEKCFKFDVQTQLDEGRTVSADTLAWWVNQSEKAREVLTPSIHDLTLFTFNDQFSYWLIENGANFDTLEVWGNGSIFDIAIGDNITKPYGECWNFRNVMCFRTFDKCHNIKRLVIRKGTAHNALDDAMYQAECVLAYWEKQRNK